MTRRFGLPGGLLLGAWIVAVVPSGLLAEDPQVRSPAVDLTAEQARDLLRERSGDPGLVILDVRTEGEFASGHLEGAVLLDFRSDLFRERLSRLDRDKTYLVYCRTGNRSGSAVSQMEEQGFRNVYHMEGGIVGWKDAGFPLTR